MEALASLLSETRNYIVESKKDQNPYFLECNECKASED